MLSEQVHVWWKVDSDGCRQDCDQCLQTRCFWGLSAASTRDQGRRLAASTPSTHTLVPNNHSLLRERNQGPSEKWLEGGLGQDKMRHTSCIARWEGREVFRTKSCNSGCVSGTESRRKCSQQPKLNDLSKTLNYNPEFKNSQVYADTNKREKKEQIVHTEE